MALSEDFFSFQDPGVEEPAALAAPWNVLVVDDDESVHAVTRLVLHGIEFQGRPLKLVSAYSAKEALSLLDEGQEFALALVDVIMETPRAGLDLVLAIRDRMQNKKIRVILRTGEPNQAPEQEIVLAYEIDAYVAKTEITARKLVTLLVSSLRAYAYIAALEKLNQELEARVEMRTAELSRLAMIDPLTGAGNRRHLEQRAAMEIRETQRKPAPLGLIMFDIDHFKRVNDQEGHAAGDIVLQRVVDRVKSELRPSDFLARIGGEEFVVLLPEEDGAGAVVVAERLRAAIAAEPIVVGSNGVAVTSSFGVTELQGEQTLDAPLQRADKALYQAKEAGRNRVMPYTA